jgi:hypothetical protein
VLAITPQRHRDEDLNVIMTIASTCEELADPGPDERGLRQGGVADPLLAELPEQTLADRETPPVPAHIFAHQENARIATHGLTDRLAQRVPVGQPPCFGCLSDRHRLPPSGARFR